jgi:methylated-DNA-[protein]-cysteine S-methyltransferase
MTRVAVHRSKCSRPPSEKESFHLAVFSSKLGWMAMVGRTVIGRTMVGQGEVLCWLSFGHTTKAAALNAVKSGGFAFPASTPVDWNPVLTKRLQDYASGKRDDFQDVCVDFGPVGSFQHRVLECCRKIPFGTTWTYGELAANAGVERAARAVGSCMARNRIPLIIPCHRVVRSDGSLGNYSAPGATATKQRLLRLEMAN